MSSLQTFQKLLGGFSRQLLGIRLSRGRFSWINLPLFFTILFVSVIFSIIDAMPMRQREIRERSEETLSEEGAESCIDVTSDKGG
jgi:hypothetical protein